MYKSRGMSLFYSFFFAVALPPSSRHSRCAPAALAARPPRPRGPRAG